jgi:MYND finger
VSRCARCKAVSYCSREHQKLDWGEHKAVCAPSEELPSVRCTPTSAPQLLSSSAASQALFPLHELVTEPELLTSESGKLDRKTAELLKEYTQSDNQNITEDELSGLCGICGVVRDVCMVRDVCIY